MASKSSVSAMVKILILLSKLKKPMIRKLLHLKKTKLIEQYSYYGYMKEYKSSPSIRRMSRNALKKLCSNVVLICGCFVGNGKEMYSVEESAGLSDSWGKEDSVDERAERFIQSFYQEMRRERDESGFQLLLEI